jgi:hypothetical protein
VSVVRAIDLLPALPGGYVPSPPGIFGTGIKISPDGGTFHSVAETDAPAFESGEVMNPTKPIEVKSGLPDNATCYFLDGNQVSCVRPSFINLQESHAGFGSDNGEALKSLLDQEKNTIRQPVVTKFKNIIATDNFDREQINDKLIAAKVPDFYTEAIVEFLNDKFSGPDAQMFFKAVPEDYELHDFQP